MFACLECGKKFRTARAAYQADYDQQKKQFVKTPTLPAWALPAAKQSA